MARSSEVIEPRQLRELERARRVIDGRGKMAISAVDRLREAQKRKSPLVAFVDGAPGVGKSGLGAKLKANAFERDKRAAEKIFTFPVDLFIGTERGSSQRAELTRNGRDFFDQHYIRYGEARDSFEEIMELVKKGRDGKVAVKDAYSREHGGKFVDTVFEVPKEVELLVVEGVGSFEQIHRQVKLPKKAEAVNIFMYAEVLQSLFRATLRDVLKSRVDIDFEELYKDREQEYAFLVPALQSSAQGADVVCRRWADEEDFGRKLVVKNREIELTRPEGINRTVRDAMNAVDPDFLRRVFPGKIPKELRPAKSDSELAPTGT